jgi:selenocysteine-specific elongation factor
MPGFGTVVTGTLINGSLRLGDELEILPASLRGRVRGLQTHKKKEDLAVPGSRTAVNISGINMDQVLRGDVIAHPGDYHPTRRIDVQFRLLPDVSQAVEHNTPVKLFLGAAEVQARLRLLGSERLDPGDSGWLQLELEQPLIAVRGDRYILRRPSPGETLGGGMVIDPHPKGRHKRFGSDILTRLEALAKGDPADILLQALFALGTAPLNEVIERSHLDERVAQETVRNLLGEGTMIALEIQGDQVGIPANSLVTSLGRWNELSTRAIQEVAAYHQTYPLRRGLPREELKSRLKLPPGPPGARLFTLTLRRLTLEGKLEETGPLVIQPGYAIHFNAQQQRQVDALLKRFAATPYAPPSVKECQVEIGEDLFTALVDLGELVMVSAEVVFQRGDYEKMIQETHQLLISRGTLTAAEARDHFNTSRRYVLAFLEHLDAIGVTLREGDIRKLKA